jgi:hypothetical protein
MECVASWEGEGLEDGTWQVSFERDEDPAAAVAESPDLSARIEVWKVAGPNIAQRFARPDEAFAFLFRHSGGMRGGLRPMEACAAPFPGGLDGPEPKPSRDRAPQGRPEDWFRFG